MCKMAVYYSKYWWILVQCDAMQIVGKKCQMLWMLDVIDPSRAFEGCLVSIRIIHSRQCTFLCSVKCYMG